VATPACVGGVCGVATCAQGFADCDGVATNGCEVGLQTTSDHCGACGTVCTATSNASASCVGGQCAPACQPGFGNCDGVAANGCELPLTSMGNCGGCGVTCAPANGLGSCATATCQLAFCNPGFADCDGTAANGCEASFTSSATCGSCSNACSGPNAMYQCVASTCQVSACAQGFSDCDLSPATGCEVHTAQDPNNCGTCGTLCNLNHAAAICTQGQCSVAGCSPGFADCDNVAADGCEISLTTNPNNCGGCGVVCALNHAITGCAQSQCTIAACTGGFADCDAVAVNGCEVNTTLDRANCGSCNHPCASNQNCVNGNCQ
jgi:hypothetical protein